MFVFTHVDTERNVTVTAVGLELVGSELERDEGNVRVVHGLELLILLVHRQHTTRVIRDTHDTLIGAVKVAVGDELLDGWVGVSNVVQGTDAS